MQLIYTFFGRKEFLVIRISYRRFMGAVVLQ